MRCCRRSIESDPTQETRATVYHADCTAPTRQHELDHTDHTDQQIIQIIQIRNTSSLKDLDQVEIDDIYDV